MNLDRAALDGAKAQHRQQIIGSQTQRRNVDDLARNAIPKILAESDLATLRIVQLDVGGTDNLDVRPARSRITQALIESDILAIV